MANGSSAIEIGEGAGGVGYAVGSERFGNMFGQAAPIRLAGMPAIGDVLAQKYRVESVVGKGGMGVVLSARHVQLGQVVAIKLLTLPPDEDRRDEAIARFLNEAQAAAKLQSDHVVRIYDVGQLEGGLPFMVMELLAGFDLGSLLDQQGALPEPEAVDYVLQACAGVAEAHRRGIVHRDLKPTNLFVTRRSDGLPLLKVLDFGISKQLTDPMSGEELPTFTNTRMLMGSPSYMSPEQVRDARRVDARTDVWALGVILQELVTDAPVFRGESFPGVCAAIVADPPMPVRTMRPDVSPELEAIIGRCLQKDAALRYQSVTELAEALTPLAPQLTRAGQQALAIGYSSSPHVAPVAAERPRPSLLNDRTAVAESSPSGHEPTLASARLRPRSGATAPTDPPDSRVEVRDLSPGGGSEGVRGRLPLAALGISLSVALGAWLWLRPTTPAEAPPVASSAPASPSTFTLTIVSEPPFASVNEGSVSLGTTPLSLTLSVADGAPPRVLVIEKEGFQPHVLRQGPAHGEVRVMAVLTARATVEPAEHPAVAPSAERADAPPLAPRQVRPPQPKPAPRPQQATPPSDIRLER
jgi:serine/threonine protein kinase